MEIHKVLTKAGIGLIVVFLPASLLSKEIDFMANAAIAHCKVVSHKPFKPEDHPGIKLYGAAEIVQDIMIQVEHVFYKPETLELSDKPFPYMSQGTQPREDGNILSTFGFHDAMARNTVAKIDTKIICIVIKSKDFGPPPSPADPYYKQHPLEQFMLCPKYSIFYSLLKPLIFETDLNKPLYQFHLEWAQAIEAAQKLNDPGEQYAAFEKWLMGENPLLGTHAVHLIARHFPDVVDERFEKWMTSPEILSEVQLAIDQELCLKHGKKWGESETRKNFVTKLETEQKIDANGNDLIWFQRRAIHHWIPEKWPPEKK